MNIDAETIRKEVIRALIQIIPEPDKEDTPNASGTGNGELTRTNALNAFGRNLTEMATKGELDPLSGAKTKLNGYPGVCRRLNNPVLIGEAGVGKTAILKAWLETPRQSPSGWTKWLRADLPLMVAGTKYRGQFEERIKAVIDEARNSKGDFIYR